MSTTLSSQNKIPWIGISWSPVDVGNVPSHSPGVMPTFPLSTSPTTTTTTSSNYLVSNSRSRRNMS